MLSAILTLRVDTRGGTNVLPWERVEYDSVEFSLSLAQHNAILRVNSRKLIELMKQYRLPVIMYQPSEDTENKYMAEVPLLSGCRAWGDTPEEALENVRSVAAEFIRSFKEHGQRLPRAVENTAFELVGPKVPTEVTVYF